MICKNGSLLIAYQSLIQVTFLTFVYKVFYFYNIWCKNVLVLPSSG